MLHTDFKDFWNVFDLAHCCILTILMINWFSFCGGPLESFSPRGRYLVYNDLSSIGRFLAVNQTSDFEMTRLLLEDFTKMAEIINFLSQHFLMQMLALMVFVVRLYKYLHFQVSLSNA